MAIPVALRDIVDALEMTADEIHHYLNKVTGEVTMVTDEEIRAIENDADWSSYPEWEHEALELAQKIVKTSDYLALPGRFEIHEYKIMESFCYSIKNPRLSDELIDLIRGSGAFRRFESAIRRHNIESQWYTYRLKALEEIAITWLEANEIAYTITDE